MTAISYSQQKESSKMNALTIRDLSVVAGEPRVLDIVLGERLGFERPRKVRDLVSRHSTELRRYGGLPQVGANPAKGSKGGRPSKAWQLNEHQALLVCLFANTPLAADVREQLIRVFMAYRAGELRAAPQPRSKRRLPPVYTAADPEPPDFRDPIMPLAKRRDELARFHQFDRIRADEAMIRQIPHLLVCAGRTKTIKWPAWFGDKELLAAVVRTHRVAKIDDVLDLLRANFGYRAPSRSSLHRFWLRLDGLFGTGRKLH